MLNAILKENLKMEIIVGISWKIVKFIHIMCKKLDKNYSDKKGKVICKILNW